MLEVYDRDGTCHGTAETRKAAKAIIRDVTLCQGIPSWNLFIRSVKKDEEELFWAAFDRKAADYRRVYGTF